jgi:cyclohexadieny/prephenate dehydrogenase / 3-phosphoshikimate 1-carboxyvinyltransferase
MNRGAGSARTFGSAAVIGLGLIGGSVARDLAARGVRVLAFDRDADQLEAALRDGIVSAPLDESLAGIAACDLIVIALPVDAAVEMLRRVAPHARGARLITDVGSTKGSIVREAAALGVAETFVGSHPMAGDHRSGWSASRSGLFDGAPVYLCAADQTSDTAFELAHALWRDLGGAPFATDAGAHDAQLAWTSHLPHMIATAIGNALAQRGLWRDDLGRGGKEMTRIAGSSPEMWTAIAVDNAPAIDQALAAFEQEIARMRSALARTDGEDLRGCFSAARAWFDHQETAYADPRGPLRLA